MYATNLLVVTSVILLGSFSFSTALYYPQYFQAFPYEYCIGTPTNFLKTTTNITQEYPGLVVKTSTVKGLWRITRGINQVTSTLITRSYNIDYQICSTVTLGGVFPALNSTEKMAAGDLDDSVLTLYGSNFTGEPLVVREEGVSKLDSPFAVGAWALTGIQGFTVFDDEDFQGIATCLDAEDTAKYAGYGISVEWTVAPEIVVKSVRFGCDENDKNVRTGNSKIRSVTWDQDGNFVEEFENVEAMPKVDVN